jgi:GntR family transcriptional regulator/MocR family aminotransferase
VDRSKGPVLSYSTGPLLELDLDRRRPLGLQLEETLRELVRSGRLPAGTRLPSTRALAGDLRVSRGVVVGAYTQLAAEGYLETRRGAAPVVLAVGHERGEPPRRASDQPTADARYNLRPDLPDPALFPRSAWSSAERTALRRAADPDLAYGEPLGSIALRHRLAPFLGRTRRVDATPDRTAVFAGSTHALHVLASVLGERGGTRIAVEDPGHRWRTRALVLAGLEVVPVPVDDRGLQVDELPDDVCAVVVSPEHQFPTGTKLAPERRRALVEWAVQGERLVVEHDYDGWFRYDHSPAGSLQPLAPEHVAYLGSASALLAPTVRLGWAVVPARLVIPLANRIFGTTIATPRISQLTLAELIDRGVLDRQLRRARTAYRARRRLAEMLVPRELPGASVHGAATGLFVHVVLAEGADEAAVLASARRKGISLDGVNEHALTPQPPGLVLGFAALAEPSLRRAIRALGRAAQPAEVAEARARLDSTEPHVFDNRRLRRYELWLGERLAGVLSYTRATGAVVLTHVEVELDLPPDDWSGRLIRDAVAQLRREGIEVRAADPTLATYLGNPTA